MTTGNDTYALLIGVDDYRGYDSSGAANLHGSVNDVEAWWSFLIERLEVDPHRIEVLVSPESGDPDKKPFPGAHKVSVATKENIEKGMEWLAHHVSEQTVGLVTYSGHGTVMGAELALCPSDTGPELENALPFGNLRTIVDQHGAAKGITVILDTCHAGAVSTRAVRSLHHAHPKSQRSRSLEPRSKSLGPTSRTLPDRAPAPIPTMAEMRATAISTRVLAACRADEVTMETLLDGRPRGAFAFALCTALGRWAAAKQTLPAGGTINHLTVSHADAMRVTGAQLQLLELSGTPDIRPDGIEDLAFLQYGQKKEPTVGHPDGAVLTEQLDPTLLGAIYAFTFDTGSPISILAVGAALPRAADGGTAGQVFDATGEYWSSTTPGAGATTMTVTVAANTTPQVPATFPAASSSVVMPTLPTWSAATNAPPAPAANVFYYLKTDGMGTVTDAAAVDLRNLHTASRAIWYLWNRTSGYVLDPSNIPVGGMVWTTAQPAGFPTTGFAKADLTGVAPPPQPQHAYLFSETADVGHPATAFNSVGSALGTLNSGASYPTFGATQPNGTVSLSTTSGSNVDFATSLLPTSNFTVAVWYQQSNTGVGPILGNWPGISSNSGVLFLLNSNKLEVRLGHDTAFVWSGLSIKPSTVITGSAWHHLALTCSVSGGTVNLTVYIDGVNVGTASGSGSGSTSSAVFRLGQQAQTITGVSGLVGGLYGDLRIFNSALSQTQIQQIAKRYTP